MSEIEIKVPELSESVSSAEVLGWKVKPGDAVEEDQVLVELETDKVVLEVSAPCDGVVTEILVKEGDTVKNGDVVAKVEEGAAKTETAPAAAAAASAPAPKPAPAPEAAAPAPAEKPAESRVMPGASGHRGRRPCDKGRRGSKGHFSSDTRAGSCSGSAGRDSCATGSRAGRTPGFGFLPRVPRGFAGHFARRVSGGLSPAEFKPRNGRRDAFREGGCHIAL